jgi:hypothetical protein
VVQNHGYFEINGQVQNTLIENCTIRNSDVGIRAGNDPSTVLAGNHFEKVLQPLLGGDNALMNPAERLLTRLSAEGLVPAKLAENVDWTAGIKKLQGLAGQPLGTEGVADSTKACQVQLALAAAQTLPDDQPLALFQALWGVDLSYPSAPLAPIFSSASGGSGQLMIAASLASWSQALTLTVQPAAPSGWQVQPAAAVSVKPGSNAATQVALTLPPGIWGPTTIPVTYQASGAGWKMQGTGSGRLGDWGDSGALTQWLIVGPFQSERAGQLGDAVYPPERRLDVAAEYPGLGGVVKWQPYVGATLDFGKLYGHPERGVAYAVTVLRAAHPTQISLTFNNGTTGETAAAYLNGERLGIPFRYGANEMACTLHQGDNVLLLASAEPGNDWKTSARVQVAPSAAPGDVQIIPADKLSQVPALRPAPLPPLPQGAALPHADGHDWQLVYDDDFNRSRLGTDWVPSAGSNWLLSDGHLAAGGTFEYLSYARPLTAPVRVECDVTGAPQRGNHWILAFTFTPRPEVEGRQLWYDLKGAGYMLALGWHDRFTNELWRQNQEVQVSAKGPFLETGVTKHVIAQFTPTRLLLVVDGQVSLDYDDPNWLPGLDTFSFFSAWSKDYLNNVRIYTAEK